MNQKAAESLFNSLIEDLALNGWYPEYGADGFTPRTILNAAGQAVLMNPILVRVVGTGRVPSGIAAGPEAPTDLIGKSVTPDTSGPTDVARFSYTIEGRGLAGKLVTLGIYRRAKGTQDAGALVLRQDIDPSRLSSGPHTWLIDLHTKLLATGQDEYVLRIDDTDMVQETHEDNNEVVFTIAPEGLSAEYNGLGTAWDALSSGLVKAGQKDLRQFGYYVQGVWMLNTFHLNLNQSVAMNMVSLQVFLDQPGHASKAITLTGGGSARPARWTTAAC